MFPKLVAYRYISIKTFWAALMVRFMAKTDHKPQSYCEVGLKWLKNGSSGTHGAIWRPEARFCLL